MATYYEVSWGDLVWSGKVPVSLTLPQLRHRLYTRFWCFVKHEPDRTAGKVLPPTYRGEFALFVKEGHKITIVPEEVWDANRRRTGEEDDGEKFVNNFIDFVNPEYINVLIERARQAIKYEVKNQDKPKREKVNRTEKVECPCGGCYTYTNRGKHILTARHRDYERQQT